MDDETLEQVTDAVETMGDEIAVKVGERVERVTLEKLSIGVDHVAEVTAGLTEELKKQRSRSTTDRVFMLLLGAVLLVLSVAMVFGLLEWRRDKGAAAQAKDGIACVIEMLEEHRFAQRAAHQEDAKVHGYTYEIPEELVAPSQAEIEALKQRLANTCTELIR